MSSADLDAAIAPSLPHHTGRDSKFEALCQSPIEQGDQSLVRRDPWRASASARGDHIVTSDPRGLRRLDATAQSSLSEFYASGQGAAHAFP